MESELKRGVMLGRYQLLTPIGQGGMASVWVARERSFGGAERLVAVKAMLPALATRDDFRSMFLDEGQIVRSISHQNVVSVFDVAEDNGVLYMAMEWVEGDSLRTLIREAKKRRAIPPEMAVRVIADTARGLHAAHELRDWDGRLCGLVHCDVSPHNILLSLNGQVKLVDFGVASATARTDKTQELLKGKLGYMSPEQVLGTGLDRRSDVFSLGVVLYELTTGERLFRGETPKETLLMVSEAKLKKPTEIYAQYPPALEAIVLKALSREAGRRYQSAEELGTDLEKYLLDERILVAKSGVGSLLKRVLGARIEQQREAIRDALKGIDGTVEGSLVPSDPTWVDRSSEVTYSGAGSFTERSWSSLSSLPGEFTRPPNSVSEPTGSASPQTLEASPKAPNRKWVGVLLILASMVVALVSVVVFLQGQAGVGPSLKGNLQAGTSAPVEPEESLEDETLSREEGSATSLSPSVLPLPRSPGSFRGPSRVEGVRIQGARVEEAPPESAGTKRSKQAEKAHQEAVDLARKEAEAAVAAEPPPPPVIEKRAPFDRAAVTSSLQAAAQRASSCGAPAGPTGSGQAVVTFHPEGYVSNVKLPGAFAGTRVGSCVANAFKQVKVAPFAGLPMALPQSFTIPE